MSRDTRIAILLILLLAAICCLPQINRPLQKKYRELADSFDKRPVVKILFIGNSRTFIQDMPFMVRKMADSAHSPTRYDITMQAPPGFFLKDHSLNQDTLRLLQTKWDYVVIQGASAENLNDFSDASFQENGLNLAKMAKLSGSKVVLYLSWQYQRGTENYHADMWPRMQESYYKLSVATGADIVNVGRAWEMTYERWPDLQLYEDGNHPNLAGAYLTALLFYKYFSNANVNLVRYVPNGLSEEKANDLKEIASQLIY